MFTQKQLSKTRFTLEYRRFGVEPVTIKGHLAELQGMARDLKRLAHIEGVIIRDSIGGTFTRQSALFN